MFDATLDTEYTHLQKAILFAFLPSGGARDTKRYSDILRADMFGIWSIYAKDILSGGIIDGIHEGILFADKPFDFGEISLTADPVMWCNLDEHVRRFVQIYMKVLIQKNQKPLTAEEMKRALKILERIDQVCSPNTGSLLDIMDETTKTMELATTRGIGYKTGLPELDRLIGGMRPGTITRLSGYSNRGKSRFMYDIINKVMAQGAKVLVLNLEVPRQYCLMYLVSNYYKISSTLFERGQYREKVIEYCGKYSKNLRIIDSVFDLDTMTSIIRNCSEDFVCIDFVQNIKGDGEGEYERMTNVAREIQRVASESGKHIFDLSQVSNDGAKNYKPGDMIPSKGSGALVHSADIGLVLHGDTNDLRITVAKNKFGPKEIEISLNADFATSTFTQKIGF